LGNIPYLFEEIEEIVEEDNDEYYGEEEFDDNDIE